MAEQMNKIKQWIVNDYFTPNIKAEVILDTLLTPYVTEILKNQAGNMFEGELYFITKEMSVLEAKASEEDAENGNRGTKIDYILGDEKVVYLVELKTTDSSLKLEQADRYLENCCGKDGQTKTFGDVFGNKLLSIMKGAFGKIYKKEFEKLLESDSGKRPRWDEEALRKAFGLVFITWCRRKEYNIEKPSRPYAGAARDMIRAKGWTQSDSARSRKYLYTAGQLLDYCEDYGRTLWEKPLKLIYLTPKGGCPTKNMDSFSLVKAGEYLKEKREDEFARMLSQVMECIYEGEEQKNG